MTSRNKISNEDEDTRILQNIFPAEVWQLIFNNIHQPDDYTRISNSSSTFKNSLLVPHGTRIVFPKIIDLIQRNCLGYHTSEGKNVLLNLRLVSRLWKSAVDKFLQNVPEHFLFEGPTDWCHYRNDLRPKICQTEHESIVIRFQDVTRFRENFDASHLSQNINPFLNREFQIWIKLDTDSFLEYMQSLLDLFRDYGTHVWYFRLRVFLPLDARDVEQLETFGVGNWIRDLLSLLPSLRTLRFMFYPDPNGGAIKPPWKQKFAEMQGYWTRNDMPHFPNLSFLEEKGLPLPLLIAVLRANPQLTSLATDSLTRAATTATYEIEMPKNLQNLSIKFRHIDQLEIFEDAKVHWQLIKLCIHARKTLQLTRLNSAAESKFGQTLRKFYVLCRQPANTPVALLNMPKLEFFHLYVAGIAPDLSFLSPVGSTLKTLYVELEPYSFYQTEELRARYLVQRNITRQDNLWRMLPKLQSLSVMLESEDRELCWYNGTREQWKWEKDQANLSIQK